jgi:8-oxo-dGTP pyrophosphatase MutT (NUDIX family)
LTPIDLDDGEEALSNSIKHTNDHRRSARVILLNAAQDVLLIRFVVERHDQPFVFWATPAGSVEDGETDLDAARRELAEELALNVVLAGCPCTPSLPDLSTKADSSTTSTCSFSDA